MNGPDFTLLQEHLGYKFKNKNYIKTALTHSSYANESKNHGPSNERLEFLGDAVLSIVVSDYIFKHCPSLPEGDLTKLRSSLVCEKALSKFANSINLGSFLFMSYGEMKSKGNERPSILADAFEAVIAAIYLDSNLDSAREFIMKFILPEIKNAQIKNLNDYKSMLQEIVQRKQTGSILHYVLAGEEGPAHDKKFLIQVCLDGEVIGSGKGKSKKEAEQQAAKQALEIAIVARDD